MYTPGVMAPFINEPINGIDEIIEMAKGNSKLINHSLMMAD
jgi:hypothetical protein